MLELVQMNKMDMRNINCDLIDQNKIYPILNINGFDMMKRLTILLSFIILTYAANAQVQIYYTGFEAAEPTWSESTGSIDNVNTVCSDACFGSCGLQSAGASQIDIDAHMHSDDLISFKGGKFYSITIYAKDNNLSGFGGLGRVVLTADQTAAGQDAIGGAEVLYDAVAIGGTDLTATCLQFTMSYQPTVDADLYIGIRAWRDYAAIALSNQGVLIDEIEVIESDCPTPITMASLSCAATPDLTDKINDISTPWNYYISGAGGLSVWDCGCTSGANELFIDAITISGTTLDVAIDNLGAGFAGDIEVQLFEGGCGSHGCFTSLVGTYCGSAPLIISETGLNTGDYTMAISSSSNSSGTTASFEMCIRDDGNPCPNPLATCNNLPGDAYAVYAPDDGSPNIECNEMNATGGSTGGASALVTLDAGATDVGTSVAITGYDVITADNFSCTTTDITLTDVGNNSNWTGCDGCNLVSGSLSSASVEVDYSPGDYGRKDISTAAADYCGFLNMVVDNATAGPILGSSDVCPDTVQFSSSDAGTIGYTYEWFVQNPTGGTSTILNDTLDATGIVLGNSTASTIRFVVKLLITSQCCGPTDTVFFNTDVFPNPSAPGTISPDTNCVGGEDTVLVSPSIFGYTYNWYNAAVGGTLLNSGDSSYVVDSTLLGDTWYYAEAVDANGCVSTDRDSVLLHGQYYAPVVPSVSSCGTGVITVCVSNAIAGANYTWYQDAALTSPDSILQNGISSCYGIQVDSGQTTSQVYVTMIDGTCNESNATVAIANVPSSPTSLYFKDLNGNQDWFDGGNWTTSLVSAVPAGCTPGCGVNAQIVNACDIAFFNGLVPAACNTITIRPGASLTFVDSKAELQVCGNWINRGDLIMDIGLVNFVGTSGSQRLRQYLSSTGDFFNVTIDNQDATDARVYTMGATTDRDVVIKDGARLTLLNGLLDVDNSVINTKNVHIQSSDPNAIVSYSANSFVVGNLIRELAAGNNYDFPVGNFPGGTYYNSYQLFQLQNVASMTGGMTDLTVRFDATTTDDTAGVGALGVGIDNVLDNGDNTGSFDGIWTANPDVGSATYDITLQGTYYSEDDTVWMTVLKRDTGSTTGLVCSDVTVYADAAVGTGSVTNAGNAVGNTSGTSATTIDDAGDILTMDFADTIRGGQPYTIYGDYTCTGARFMEYSLDGAAWTDVGAFADLTGTGIVITPPTDYRYVRIGQTAPCGGTAGGNQTFTTANDGTNAFTVPAGVTSITVQVWGAGGGGGGNPQNQDGGGGGGGGGYSESTIAVTPGQQFDVTVGAGGSGSCGNTHGIAGGQSFFNTVGTVMANGGGGGLRRTNNGGDGGAGAAAGAGTITRTGGNGAEGINSNAGAGGGGGEGAGPTCNGQALVVTDHQTAGGTGCAGGGDGGDGGTAGSNSNNGYDGTGPGGGGGGAADEGSNNRCGGDGADGSVVVTWPSTSLNAEVTHISAIGQNCVISGGLPYPWTFDSSIDNVTAGIQGSLAIASRTGYPGFSQFAIGVAPELPLAVSMVNFTGVAKNNAVFLNWITESEKENDHFILQRSQSGSMNDWDDVATVDGQGSTSLEQVYNYVDMKPFNGLSYYRLMVVNKKGEAYPTNTIAVTLEKDIELTLYPNPARNEIHLNIEASSNGYSQLIVYNAIGEVVYQKWVEMKNGLNMHRINLTSFESGVYHLQLKNTNSTQNMKFVKN